MEGTHTDTWLDGWMDGRERESWQCHVRQRPWMKKAGREGREGSEEEEPNSWTGLEGNAELEEDAK